MSRLEAREEKRDRYWVLRVDPAFDPENPRKGFHARVTAYCEQDYMFETGDYAWKRAVVSCSSMSNADGNEASVYARALELCAAKAKEMDTAHGYQQSEVKA